MYINSTNLHFLNQFEYFLHWLSKWQNLVISDNTAPIKNIDLKETAHKIFSQLNRM